LYTFDFAAAAGGGLNFLYGMNGTNLRLGEDILILPDRGKSYFTLGPRVSFNQMSGKDSLGPGVRLRMTSLYFQSIAIPLLWNMNFSNSAREEGGFSIGYGIQIQSNPLFRYYIEGSSEPNPQKGHIGGSVHYGHFIPAYFYYGYDKFAFKLGSDIQLNRFFNKKDQPSLYYGNVQYPIFAKSGGMFAINLEITYRLLSHYGERNGHGIRSRFRVVPGRTSGKVKYPRYK
jgi:hypothetical protein